MHLLPWLVLGATQAWLHSASASQPRWWPVLAEAVAFLWVGFALHRLGTGHRRWAAHPVWALAIPLTAYTFRYAPSGIALLPYVVGVGVLVLGGAYQIAHRWRAALVPIICAAAPMVVVLHVLDAVGSDQGWKPVIERARRDIAGPFAISSAQGTLSGRSIVWITVDTLRADDAQRMEAWSRLSARGAWWPAAQAPSSWTLPSVASLHTGVPSSAHGAGCLPQGFCQGLAPDVSTFAMQLRDSGYATLGISANPWAGRNNGLERGFQQFHDLGVDRRRPLLLTSEALLGAHPQSAEAVIDQALAALSDLEQQGAYFLWVHLIDPHLPYTHDDGPLAGIGAEMLRNANVVPPEQRQQLREAYRAEIAYTDHHVMRLVDALDDEAIVVFTSDHGEEFWEHGGVEHGHSHHREVIEVPLVIVGPGMRRGRHTSTVSLLDVVPTMLGMLDRPLPEGIGTDLRRPLSAPRYLPVEGSLHHRPLCSAVSEEWRVIRHDCQGPTERTDSFDLARDPLEVRPKDLPMTHPGVRAAHRIELPSPRSATFQDTEALEALGYID